MQKAGNATQSLPPLKARPVPLRLMKDLAESDQSSRAMMSYLSDEDSDKDSDWGDNDGSSDAEGEDERSSSLLQAWRKTYPRSRELGFFDMANPDIRFTFIPIEIFFQRMDSEDESEGFVVLQPDPAEPATIHIVLFGITTESLRRDALRNIVSEAAIFTQMRLEDSGLLKADGFEMVIRAQVPIRALTTLGDGLYAKAGFTATTSEPGRSQTYELTKRYPRIDLSSKRLQYTFILRNR